ncbi:MAG: anti-sigma factor [Actinobacteria bacterium]|nr:anti-sigma factor [Actinomycetota bacterium]
MNEQEFAELAAGRALHALSPDDERAFDAALARHPAWQSIIDSDIATVGELVDVVPDVSPPPALRGALLDAIASIPQGVLPVDVTEEPTGETTAPLAPRRRFGTRTWFALAASFVLLLGLGTGTVLVSQQLNRPAAVVALDRIDSASDAQSATVQIAGGGEATAHWSNSLGQAVLVSDGLPQLASDKTFELWYVRGETPVPAGVFTASADGSATAVLDGAMHAGDLIAVTVEQSGGSPTGVPTTTPILAVPTTA